MTMSLCPEPHARSLPNFVNVARVRGSVILRHDDNRPHRLSPRSGLPECTAWAMCNLRLPCIDLYTFFSERKQSVPTIVRPTGNSRLFAYY